MIGRSALRFRRWEAPVPIFQDQRIPLVSPIDGGSASSSSGGWLYATSGGYYFLRGTKYGFREFGIHYSALWWATSPSLVLGVLAYMRYRDRQRYASRGRCGVCGYDLRATPERCPECGTHATRSAGSI